MKTKSICYWCGKESEEEQPENWKGMDSDGCCCWMCEDCYDNREETQ